MVKVPTSTLKRHAVVNQLLTNSKNGSESNHQHSSNRTRQQRDSIKEVVLHYPMMSPALEDWVLFPDEVVRCKNSSVRNPQNHTAPKGSLRSDRGLACSSLSAQTASTTIKKSPSQCLIAHESQDRSRSLRTSDQLGSIKKSLDTATGDVDRNPPKVKAPQRLPTPDLSDVEEDAFWSCCSSVDSSRSG